MNRHIFLLVIMLLVSCTQDERDQRWIENLNSMVFTNSSGQSLEIQANGNVVVPLENGDLYLFSFDQAKSETEAFYKENGKLGFAGLKLSNGELGQVGTKSDATSGATLSQKKDFIDFSKWVKTLGTVISR
ncbi:MAG: hypothetical protein ACRCWI_04225 [Brevinema sp.]